MADKSDKEILEKARKLKKLWKRGDPGERDNAEKKYRAHLKKHDLEDHQVDPDQYTRRFYMESEDSRIILFNIIVSVNPFANYHTSDGYVIVELDDEDFKEVTEKVAYFLKLWKVEKELLLMAFAAKHKYYFKPDEKALRKARGRQEQNEAIKKSSEAMAQATAAYNSKINKKPQTAASAMSLKDETSIQAFNISRIEEMMAILLEANYKKHFKNINY